LPVAILMTVHGAYCVVISAHAEVQST
jgi:hypothetical protein